MRQRRKKVRVIPFCHLLRWREAGAFGLAMGMAVPSLVGATLDRLLEPCHSEVRKWATVIRVEHPEQDPAFHWFHYRDSADSVAFWPASTIKIYAVAAAAEWLNARHLPLESAVIFSRQTPAGVWVQDCARTVPEMFSEVFRRSSNEDYTLLLRMVGIDAINTRFLIPEKGFPHSALMRDYVTYRPVVYENDEPQRVRILSPEGAENAFEHRWSGVSYAEQRGATIFSAKTGNCTSTRELADCLRRLLFHEKLPESERYDLTAEQVRLIRHGDPERGLVGLENRLAGPYGWEQSGEKLFPKARYFHKAGLISSYVLDVCYLSDADSDQHLILALAAETGKEQVIRDMALVIYEAAQQGGFRSTKP